MHNERHEQRFALHCFALIASCCLADTNENKLILIRSWEHFAQSRRIWIQTPTLNSLAMLQSN